MEKHDQILYSYLITGGHVTYSVTRNKRLLYLGQKSNLSIFFLIFNIRMKLVVSVGSKLTVAELSHTQSRQGVSRSLLLSGSGVSIEGHVHLFLAEYHPLCRGQGTRGHLTPLTRGQRPSTLPVGQLCMLTGSDMSVVGVWGFMRSCRHRSVCRDEPLRWGVLSCHAGQRLWPGGHRLWPGGQRYQRG